MATYSFHTFYFPFVWNAAGGVSFSQYIAKVESGKWKNISLTGYADIHNDNELGMTPGLKYQAVQYFTESARESVFGWDRDFVRYYAYDQANVCNKAVYRILKGDFEYKLNLNGIKLKIFNTGIGILSFETENDKYASIDDIKRINEYGRRIFAPFFPASGDSCYLCADSLGVDYKSRQDYSHIASAEPKDSNECVPSFIRNLLPDSPIKPAIDDRMFVACLVNANDSFVAIAKENVVEKLSKYTEDEAGAKSLYELAYIDLPGSCSCPDKTMRDSLLEKSIYRRWAAYGTLTAVTHHSFVTVTNANEPHIVEIPFLIQYTHIITIVLAQRASIIAFDEISSKLSAGFEDSRSGLSVRKIKELLRLQEKYIAFLNQHNNIEITCQEQGIELYRMLQAEMYVEEDNEKLAKEIEILSETANTVNDYNLNQWAIALAILLVFAQPIADWLFYAENVPQWSGFLKVMSVTALGIVLWYSGIASKLWNRLKSFWK